MPDASRRVAARRLRIALQAFLRVVPPAVLPAGPLALLFGLLPAGPLAAQSDWPLHGHDAGAQRWSPLREIDTLNVKRLEPVWTYRSGVTATFQATPIVVDGVMYVSLPFSGVVAIDAATGALRWRYDHKPRSERLCCGPANRGVAVAKGLVYVGTVDGRLIALDARSGAVRWDVTVAEYAGTTERMEQLKGDDPLARVGQTGSTGVGISAAPIVADGLVIVGIAGVGYGLHPDQGLAVVGLSGQYGRPGLLAAFDAKSGALRWRFDVTQAGWEGAFTARTIDGLALPRDTAAERAAAAGQADAWRYGGGSIYASPAVDLERGLLFVGTGNPSPQMADASRPGDNLYTSSLVALELRTGRRVWHRQIVPHDRWGYDVVNPPVLVEVMREGRRVPAVVHASKLGWVYVFDRRDGTLLFRSESFVPQRNLFSAPAPGEGVVIAPGIAGGANWGPSAYDPVRGLFYVAALHLPTRYLATRATRPDGSVLEYASTQETGERGGTLTALDLRAGGRVAWQVKTADPLVGGVLATAGGLVFSGAGGKKFAAFNSATGAELWSWTGEAGVNAPPVTYRVGGRQYVAVAVGGNALFGFPQGDWVVGFAVAKGGVGGR
ncbi:MAG: PQQ-binding-like beta-propeller repeat protein [Gemmatimonadales bacterium]|nr:PQQ-binding-like beta-propeller repeat protein [Gemmatimonadales bacterium]